MKILLLGVALVTYVSLVEGDLYIHNCRGSNNRLNEKSATRANGNRAFDSQNNARGGYNMGDKYSTAAGNDYSKQYRMEYVTSPVDEDKGYTYLPLEWTNQHGCGSNTDEEPNKLNCNLVIQMMCEEHQEHDQQQANKDEMRDGVNTNTQNYQAPNNEKSRAQFENRFNQQVDANKVYHEPISWYDKCTMRKRNHGLFTADQNLKKDKSTHTRQNPQGTRRGYECPEERDYYPYWHPTPWKDLIILAEREDRCPYYEEHSFNVAPKHECVENWEQGGQDPPKHYSVHNNQNDCEAAGHIWRAFHNYLEILHPEEAADEPACQAKNTTAPFIGKLIWGFPMDYANPQCMVRLQAPECKVSPWSRVNHLGNGKNLEANRVDWKIPAFPSGRTHKCVLRMRYNISTDDYNVETQDNKMELVKTFKAPDGDKVKTFCRWGSLPKENGHAKIEEGIGDDTTFLKNESFTFTKKSTRTGPCLWIGFQSREFSKKYLKFSFHIMFVDTVPARSNNFGMKVYGTIYNEWVDTCKANEWCYVEKTVKNKRGGDGNHVILIFDTVPGLQVIKVAQLRVGIFGQAPSPIYNNPTVDVGTPGSGLRLAINTAQFGRTFEDRCHVMLLKSLDGIFTDGQVLHQIAVRGKRGNIVQTFPAVEYDFMPTDVTMNKEHYVTWQWTGSNTHNNGPNGGDGQTGDAGQGQGGTDRSNICAVRNRDESYCLPTSDPDHICNHITKVIHADDGNLTNVDLAIARQDVCIRWMSAGYYKCLWARDGCTDALLAANGDTTKEKMSNLLNNAPASFGGTLIVQLDSGVYHYISSRNNAFTNRSQKGSVTVEGEEETGETTGPTVTETTAPADEEKELDDMFEEVFADENLF